MTEAEKRNKVLATCEKYLGTKESPANSNNVLFNTRFYGHEVHDGDKPGASYQWCGTSVSEIFIEASCPLGNIGYLHGYASVPYAIQNIAKWGKEVPLSEAKPGDIAMIDFNKDGKWDHTGIIKTNVGPVFHIYEGNTSSDDKGHQSNGGEYCLKQNRDSTKIGIRAFRPNIYNS